jgi:hypothetical protein
LSDTPHYTIAELHHCRVDAFKLAVLEQDHLAAATLLRRRAEDHDAEGKTFANSHKSSEGGERSSADEVVAAGVAVGQRVVFSEDRDCRARLTDDRAKGGLEAADATSTSTRAERRSGLRRRGG